MKKVALLFFALLLFFPRADYAQSDAEKEAVRQAVLDYVEGVYDVAPERIERSVHPDLAKRGFYIKKGEKTYTSSPMTFTELVNLARNYNKDGKIPKDAPKDIVVFDVLDQIACAKLTAAWGVDYFQLAKYDGKWKIVNVLWQSPPRAAATAVNNIQREVAITFDDLPASYGNGDLERFRGVTSRLLQSIKVNNVPAIGFVNEGKLHSGNQLKERTALLKMWVDAGLDLGNHTYSHIAIDQVPLSAYQEDVIRGETVTRSLLAEKGKKLRYFRHTQLRTGPTPEYKKGLEQFLASRGYTIAPVTIDNNDFMFAAVYGDAKMHGDTETMKRVADAYVPYMESVFEFFEKLSVDFLGYEVKQTLLLHANDLNADHFDDLVRMMKKRGYSFITLEEALKDQAYQLPDALDKQGLSWIHRWMKAKGMEIRPEPSEPKHVSELFQAWLRARNW
jgi:peptidoglycan/xylan/chitin deacetylase (PgdA/CDA1 family)